MNKKTKQSSLFFLFSTLLMVILIAAGLSGLKLEPGMPLPEIRYGQGTMIIADKKARYSFSINGFLKTVILLIPAALFLLFCYQVVKRMKWKEWRIILLSILLGCLGMSGILFILFYFLSPSSIPVVPKTSLSETLSPLRSPLGPAPEILTRLLVIGIAGLSVFLGLRIITSKGRSSSENMINLIGLEAELAREALLNGRNFKDTVTRCYRQMALALKQEKGIEREDSMTAGEFEVLLEAAGVPQDSARELTRLFEAVRYGNRQPGPEDEQKAIRQFETIVQFFKEEERRKLYEKI